MLSHLTFIAIVVVTSYIGLIGHRAVDLHERSRVNIDGVPTRTVVTERISTRPASAPSAAKAPTKAPAEEPEHAEGPPVQGEPKKKVDAAARSDGPTLWTAQEIANAAALCATALQSPTIRAKASPPLRSGQCGDAAPIEMSAAGAPNVSLQPAIITNCRVAGAVDVWVTTVLQPAAKEILGSPVISMNSTSSYVCRNRNGAASGPISEHAFANAFDVGSFRLADGRTVDVAAWGATVVKAVPAMTNGAAKDKGIAAAATVPATPATPAGSQDLRLTFLKRIHREACPLFGTVLGPEANDAHREHLHFDMKDRHGRTYCQ